MPSIISATTTNGLVTSADNSGSLQLATNNGTTAVTIDTSQNVGIGTTSPAAVTGFTTDRKVVQVTNNGYGQLRLGAASGTMIDHDDSGNTTTTIRSLYGATSASAQMQLQSGFITFGTGTSYTERMRIDSSGNVLVGTSTNTTNGGFIFSPNFYGTGRSTQVIGHINGASSGDAYIVFNYNGTGIGSITQNGTTATAYNTSSDYRLKENIAPMTGALATVSQLKPVTYKWKADGSSGQGFIAHELQAVVPDCVTGEKDSVDADGNPIYQGIDTSFLVATLTAAIQEQQAMIEELKAEVQALKGVA